jgi:DNA-binding MarR family transcriptional regulator
MLLEARFAAGAPPAHRRLALARDVLRSHSVNYYFFAMKRAHHAALRISRDVAAGFGLTPARSDMLYAIDCVPVYAGPAGRGELTQSELRQKLGVSAPTVSRMVRSLELLGFVERRPSYRDGRTLDIRLTDFGWRRARALFFELFKWDVLGFALDCAVVVGLLPMNPDKVERRLYDLYDLTTRIRLAFGDRATLEYPYFEPESQFRT